MERIAEIMKKFPACCLKDTCGSSPLCTEKCSAISFARRLYDILGEVSSICRRSDLMTMETLILASLCVGAIAGVRLRVFVLFPLIILCLIMVTAWGLAQNETGWSIVVMNFVGSACLQLGYLAGTVPSFLLLPPDQGRLLPPDQGRREHPQPVRPFAR
jgi:hypothetical protein